MGFFSGRSNEQRYGVILDIGSGSVLAAIVHSDPERPHPKIVWSHREHAPLRNIDTLTQSSKAVMSALVNVSMQLDAEGRQALYEYDKSAKLSDLQCSISAPWSYTVTKTANFNQETPFPITAGLIDELKQTIGQQIEEDLKNNESLQELGLQIITKSTMDMLSNGYRVPHPEGQTSSSFSISHASVVAQEYLVDAINEMHDKLFTETECRKISFMLMLFSATRQLFPNNYDMSLIDVTYEATEIGIVRNGSLTYSTHTPFGSFSLAREISVITKVPLHEAFGYLHTDKPMSFMGNLNEGQKTSVETVFEEYIVKVSELLHQTGDSLSIPKNITIHSDLNSESLFSSLIEKAVKRTIKTEPNITNISFEILSKAYGLKPDDIKKSISGDTALLVSAQFFHNDDNEHRFEYV